MADPITDPITDLVRDAFALDHTVVDALEGVEPPTGHTWRDPAVASSQERYRRWGRWLRGPKRKFVHERLIPAVVRPIERSWPAWMAPAGPVDADDLRARIAGMAPWFVPFRLGDGVTTLDGMQEAIAAERFLFRRELINGTVAALLGDAIADTTILDIGCNCGYFSLDLASRGAQVTGADLRPENIRQARFLQEHFGIEGASFHVSDADDLPEQQYDVVVNLGVLYHVTNPIEFVQQTYRLCRRFAVIDTLCLLEPVSGYMLLGDKDTDIPAEGREVVEMHPTYRGAIDTIRFAGFSEVFELVGEADPPHDLYATGKRRAFLCIK